jgi:hypothetical protein
MVMMNMIDSICEFIESAQDKSRSKKKNIYEIQPALPEKENSSYELIPRDGMSLESAKRAIGRCADNSQFEIHRIENKGRYFTAKVMDSKGKPVNEILVDKLNGRVRFLR